MRPTPLIVLFASVLLVGTASAQPTSGPSAEPAGRAGGDVRATYAQAQALFKAGSFGDALPLFREVVTALDSPNARLYVARCLRELGRLGEAYEEMHLTVRDAASLAATEERFVPTRDAATRELAELRRQVGMVVVTVAEPPSGLLVQVAGRSVPQTRLGKQVAVGPGSVEVVATAPGHDRAQQQVEITPGKVEQVMLTLRPTDPGSVAPPPPGGTAAAQPPPPPPDEGGGFGLLEGGIVAGGVGVAGMAVFAIAGLMADSRYDEVAGECGGSPCPDGSYDERIDEGETMDLVANVGLVVGLVGLATGAALIIADLAGADEGSSTDGARGLQLVVTPAGAWGGYQVAF